MIASNRIPDRISVPGIMAMIDRIVRQYCGEPAAVSAVSEEDAQKHGPCARYSFETAENLEQGRVQLLSRGIRCAVVRVSRHWELQIAEGF